MGLQNRANRLGQFRMQPSCPSLELRSDRIFRYHGNEYSAADHRQAFERFAPGCAVAVTVTNIQPAKRQADILLVRPLG